MNRIKQFLRPTTTLISIRFISLLFVLILLTGCLVLFIFGWIIGILVQDQTLRQEHADVDTTITQIDSTFTNASFLIHADYASQTFLTPQLVKYFDVGVIKDTSGKQQQLSLNTGTFPLLQGFVKSITPSTPTFVYDQTNHLVYITYIIDGSNFETGAVSLASSTISTTVSSSTYHMYLIDTNNVALSSNTKGAIPDIINTLHLNYNNVAQYKIGNIHRQVLTYEPSSLLPLGVIALSDPLTDSVITSIKVFSSFLSLIGLSLFLAIIVIYSLLIDIPLIRILTFFDDYFSGKVRTIQNNAPDTFGIISQNINKLIEKLKQDYSRIDKADEIQDDFIYLSSHMLRTPLTAVIGYLDMLKSANKDEHVTPLIENIENGVGKLDQIEQNLLSIAENNNAIIYAKEERVDMRQVMDEAYKAMEKLAKSKNINYILDTTLLDNPMVLINSDNMVLALKNLIDNAIKFTAEGGTVKVYGQIKQDMVIVSVSDTGIGLTEDEKGIIFKKFSRVSDSMQYNEEGLGLGLYVTKLTAETHKGKVWVDSIKGSGSIFNVALPLNRG